MERPWDISAVPLRKLSRQPDKFTRHFGPGSGADPKIRQAMER
jgi:hypothetical protein